MQVEGCEDLVLIPAGPGQLLRRPKARNPYLKLGFGEPYFNTFFFKEPL